MIFTLVLIALLAQALGLFALLINIRQAPEGYEDEAGFHARVEPQVGNFYDTFTARQPKRTLTLAEAATRQGSARSAAAIRSSPRPARAMAAGQPVAV